MAKKKNIKWMRKIAWLLFYAAVTYTLFAAVHFKANQRVSEVVIEITSGENQRPLIGKKDVLRYINKSLDVDLEMLRIDELNVIKIEEILNSSRFVEHAEVFVNTKGVVNITCIVRTPIVRIDTGNGKGFYLDKSGNIIPLSKKATVRVPYANGHLGKFKKDFLVDQSSRYKGIYEMALKVEQDEFLSALIEQIYVEEDGELILIPKLGRQKILFGDLASSDHKFEKLKAFYKTGMPNSGWNRFEYLNLKWKNQVIGEIATN